MNELLIKKGIVWFDLETPTEASDALVREGSAIAQIASIVTDFDLNPIDQIDLKIKFKKEAADPLILEKIGYSDNLWAKEALAPNEAAEAFIRFIQPYSCVTKEYYKSNYQAPILAGHNIRAFDIPVLLKWYKNVNEHYQTDYWFPGSTNPSFDTRSLVGLFGFLNQSFFPSEALTYLCERFEINTEGRHNALQDLEKTIEVAKLILERIQLR